MLSKYLCYLHFLFMVLHIPKVAYNGMCLFHSEHKVTNKYMKQHACQKSELANGSCDVFLWVFLTLISTVEVFSGKHALM